MEMPLRMGIVLMPQFTLGALAPFADMVGLLPSGSDEQPLCTAEIVADTLIPVRSANGTQIVPEGLLGEAARFDCVVLVGGAQAPEPGAASTGLHVWLRQAARAGCHLVGLCSAVFVLAEAGLLDGRRLSLNAAHWPAFVQRFPAFEPWQLITDRLHVQDGRRITCAGGTGALLETVLQILRRHLPAQGIRQALLGLQQAEPGPGALLAPAPRPETASGAPGAAAGSGADRTVCRAAPVSRPSGRARGGIGAASAAPVSRTPGQFAAGTGACRPPAPARVEAQAHAHAAVGACRRLRLCRRRPHGTQLQGRAWRHARCLAQTGSG